MSIFSKIFGSGGSAIVETISEWAKVKVETEGWVSRRYLKTFE